MLKFFVKRDELKHALKGKHVLKCFVKINTRVRPGDRTSLTSSEGPSKTGRRHLLGSEKSFY